MQHSIFLICAGLTCGLFATTWSQHLASSPPAENSRVEERVSTLQDPAPASQQSDETDRERLERKVRKFLEANGTQAVQKRTMKTMLDQFEKMGLPPEFGEKFMDRFDLDHVMDLAVGVYADHLDEPTVDALTAFYATPSGRKLAEATPDITAEITEASMKYGQEIGTEVGAEMGK